jgi:arabinofuranan 3-O-arabinosyltransferase
VVTTHEGTVAATSDGAPRPARGPAVLARVWRHLDVALLLALAFLPAVTAGVGRMVADTKLYLYLDPGRLVGDAPFSFDPRQFAGWVPHQTISYLWPSGPWFWFWEQVGLPDWLAHRLWIGTVLAVAGLGARWLARELGIGRAGAVAVGALYLLSPFILPYLSRTSLMLLPFAGLGWIVGLTVRAARTGSWRHPALLALVLATVAAPNATAILMVAPAPVLWLLHAAFAGEITWRRATTVAAKVAGLGLAVSLWWLGMLVVQGRYGADVLAYSETLEAVSLTATGPETLRGLGYWLFYVRDPVGFTTSAAEDYLVSGRLVLVGVTLTTLALLGLAVVRFPARRFAALLVIVGTVLAVGVHPIDDPSPLMAPFASSSRSSFVLALRSSTRALPMSVLGMALATGALAAAVGRLAARRAEVVVARRRVTGPDPSSMLARLPRAASVVPAAVVVVLAVVNLPAATNGGFVDPILGRDQDPPAAWLEAAAALDAAPAGSRVLQVPGAEFGAFAWGYTVDPPLPGLTDRPLVTRDLLPLGSPPAMDLVYALDDRFQDGTVEVASIAPVARLLGVDRVWVTNDAWFDRFRTPRPETVAALFAEGTTELGRPLRFGPATVRTSVLEQIDESSLGDPRIGTPLEPVWLVEVADPEPVVRVRTDTVVVAGSGDGVVDAAAAGVLDGRAAVLYATTLAEDPALAATLPDPIGLVVTDSHRDQARQWRGSQNTRGFTEVGGPETGVLRFDSADQRLDVFGDGPDGPAAEAQTIAVQDGPLQARASAYGEPFAYRPEDRPVFAVDGDPATAWRVADRFDARGEFIELTAAEPIAEIRLHQPGTGSTGLTPNRWITELELLGDDGVTPWRVVLDERSRDGSGQPVALPAPTTRLRLTVVATAEELAPGTRPDAVGLAEIRAVTADGRPLDPTREVVRPPVDWLPIAEGRPEVPVTAVLTRWRVEPTDRWRRDPEPTLDRRLELPDTLTEAELTGATVRLDRRAADTVLAELLGWDGTVADDRLTGIATAGGWAATDGDPQTAWQSSFGRTTGIGLEVPATGAPIGELRLRQPGGDHSRITALAVTPDGDTAATRVVPVPAPDADGWSTVTVGDLTPQTSFRLTVHEAEPVTTRDRRSAELVPLPVAIAEVVGPAVAGRPLPTEVDLGCRSDLLTVGGRPVPIDLGTVAVDALLTGAPIEALPCAPDTRVGAGAGSLEVRTATGATTGLTVDRVLLDLTPGLRRGLEGTDEAAARTEVEATVTSSGRTHRTVTVEPCPSGCWFVFGEGLNPGWEAELDGAALPAATLVDGGFHGWWLPPAEEARELHLRWTPQPIVTFGLVVSGLAVLAVAALALLDRGRGRGTGGGRAAAPALVGWRSARVRQVATRSLAVRTAAVTGVLGALLVAPVWGLLGLGLGAAAGLLRRPRLLVLGAAALWTLCGLVIVARMVRLRPFPDASWPGQFEDLHRPSMFVLALLAGGLVAEPRVRRHRADPPAQ